MTDQEFFASIKAGQYVKTGYRKNKPRVRKVSKVTRTQIVFSEWGWSDKPNVDRFRIVDGYRLGDSFFNREYIVPRASISDEEIAAYEARISEGERMRKERKRIAEVEAWAKSRLFSIFGEHIPAENIKISLNSSDGMKTVAFEIKLEKVSEQSLALALTEEKQGVTA